MATVIQSINASPDFLEPFKALARKAGAFARNAVTNSYQYPSYMDVEDFQQEALVAALEAEISFDASKGVPFEAYGVLKIKERFQAVRRLAERTHNTLFEQVMIDLLKPDEIDALFSNEPALQTAPLTEKVDTFMVVYDFIKVLTPRLQKVFRTMYLGYTQAEAAQFIGVSQPTIVRDVAKVKKFFVAYCETNNLESWAIGNKLSA